MNEFGTFLTGTLKSQYKKASFRIGLNGFRGVGKSTFVQSYASKLSDKNYTEKEIDTFEVGVIKLPSNITIYAFDIKAFKAEPEMLSDSADLTLEEIETKPFYIAEHANQASDTKKFNLIIEFNKQSTDFNKRILTIKADEETEKLINQSCKNLNIINNEITFS